MHNDLLVSVSMAALFLGISINPATAQTSTKTSSPAAEQATPMSDAAERPSADSEGLLDIVVTAQRREERALRVPISITTISPGALQSQGTTSIASLSQSVPGLQINRSLNSATPFLRGVGNPSGAAGEEGATGIYIDGVYSTSQYANMFEFNDIERIEVLKGPQGTLFGRNSAGGAILITTRTPKHDFSAEGDISYANYDTVSGSAYVTGGLTDTIAASVSFQARSQGDGWGRNLTIGADNGKLNYRTIRGKMLWEPDDRTRVTLAGDHYKQEERQAGRPIVRSALGATNPGNYNSVGDFDTKTDMFNWGTSLRVEHEANPFSIISTTAFRKTRSVGYFDFDASAIPLVRFDPIIPSDAAVQQEFQLQSKPSSPVKFVVGVFLLSDIAKYDLYTQVGLGTPATATGFITRNVRQKTNSAAGFGQVTIPVMTHTNLTLGGRYSIDDRKLDYTQVSSNPAANVGTRGPVKISYPSTTWRVSLDHQLNDDVLLYASVNRGFKSGVFNLNTPTDPAVAPETVTAYEAGLKGRFLHNRLQIELAGFHTNFTDIQLRQVLASGGTRLVNAASARINGGELSVQALPIKGLTLSGSLSVLDTNFTSFPGAPATVPLPAVALAGGVCPAASSGPAAGGNLSCTIDARGNHLLQAPPFSGNLGFTYEAPVGDGSLILTGGYSYTSHFWWEPDNRLVEPEHSIVSASIGYRAPDNRWGIRVWGRNLTNEYRSGLQNSSALGDNSTPGAEPRVFGVTLSTRLGR